MADGAPRLVLIATVGALPGLLPIAAVEALRTVDTILLRDPDTHPSAPYLTMLDLPVGRAAPARPERIAGLDLMAAGGGSGDVRLARGLVDACRDRRVAYVLSPDEAGFERTIAMEAAKVGGIEVEFAFPVGVGRGLGLLRLVETMAALRDPASGCPWDLEQDHVTLGHYLLEEAYELVDAIAAGDDAGIAEELGDVALQVVFHAQVAQDRAAFDIDAVAAGIVDKLVRRHPHVFADGDAATPAAVQANWDRLKAAEKPHRTGPFDGVPNSLPALMLATELRSRAERAGLGSVGTVTPRPPTAADAPDDPAATLGNALFALVEQARADGVDPEAALRASARSYRERCEAVVERARARGLDVDDLDTAAWQTLWDEVASPAT